MKQTVLSSEDISMKPDNLGHFLKTKHDHKRCHMLGTVGISSQAFILLVV